MSNRTVHIIHHKCDILVEAIGHDHVRIRLTESNPELLNPTDFEIEGSPMHIWEALTSAALVLANIDEISRSTPS